MLESLKKLQGSSLEAYVKERSEYWKTAFKLSQGQRLVRSVWKGYEEFEMSLHTFSSYADLATHLQDRVHVVEHRWAVDIGAQAVILDILEFIKIGKPLIPKELIHALDFIETHLTPKIRQSCLPPKSFEEWEAERRQQRLKEAQEEEQRVQAQKEQELTDVKLRKDRRWSF